MNSRVQAADAANRCLGGLVGLAAVEVGAGAGENGPCSSGEAVWHSQTVHKLRTA